MTAAALMIGVALVAFVAIFAAGLRGSIDKSVDGTFPAGQPHRRQPGRVHADPRAGGDRRRATSRASTTSPRCASPRRRCSGDTGTTPRHRHRHRRRRPRCTRRTGRRARAATLGQLGDDGVVVDTNSGVGKGKKVGDKLVLTTPTGEQVTYTIKGLLDAGDFSLLGGGIVVPNDRAVARLQREGRRRSSSSTSPTGRTDAADARGGRQDPRDAVPERREPDPQRVQGQPERAARHRCSSSSTCCSRCRCSCRCSGS